MKSFLSFLGKRGGRHLLTHRASCLGENQGLSLTETMVGAAILGIVAFTASLVTQNVNNSILYSKASTDFANLSSMAVQIFAGPKACFNALNLASRSIALAALQQKDRFGNFIPYETAFYNGGRPVVGKGIKFGTITVTGSSLVLQAANPFSTTPAGEKSFLVAGQVLATRKATDAQGNVISASQGGYGAMDLAVQPFFFVLTTDASGNQFTQCSQLSNEAPPPQCNGALGNLLTTADRVTYSCGPAPKPMTAFDKACQQNGGYVVEMTDTGSKQLVCIVSDPGCPSGWAPYLGYSETVSSTCYGGSTTNCNNGYSCTTGSHKWSNKSPSSETCVAATNVACGPVTSGGVSCYSRVTRIACVAQMALR